MDKKQILKRLRNDEDYYGDFGKQYLSNSDISTLLKNPLALGKESKKTAAFLVGGYLHTAILEPDKLKKYKVIPSSTEKYISFTIGDIFLRILMDLHKHC